MLLTGSLNGHSTVVLENDRLRVTVLPEKGADIYALVHKPTGIDALMKTPAGLRPPAATPPQDFLDNYEGGWQELFPSANEACRYQDQEIPFHGEVALLPWQWKPEDERAGSAAAVFSVRSRRTPFRLSRRMSLEQGSDSLVLEESVVNDSDRGVEFVWGHHIVLGAPFLQDGCTVETTAATLLTPDEVYEPATARLAPGQREPWPLARALRGEEPIDLRHVPGPEAHSHDDAFLTDFGRGHLAVTNPRLGLRFELTWDAGVFPWMAFWQPYGGADLPPLTGIYGLGIEPWASRYNLVKAIEHGRAAHLGPAATFTTRLEARFGGLEGNNTST